MVEGGRSGTGEGSRFVVCVRQYRSSGCVEYVQ